jgi:hypothetical protein
MGSLFSEYLKKTEYVKLGFGFPRAHGYMDDGAGSDSERKSDGRYPGCDGLKNK